MTRRRRRIVQRQSAAERELAEVQREPQVEAWGQTPEQWRAVWGVKL